MIETTLIGQTINEALTHDNDILRRVETYIFVLLHRLTTSPLPLSDEDIGVIAVSEERYTPSQNGQPLRNMTRVDLHIQNYGTGPARPLQRTA